MGVTPDYSSKKEVTQNNPVFNQPQTTNADSTLKVGNVKQVWGQPAPS